MIGGFKMYTIELTSQYNGDYTYHLTIDNHSDLTIVNESSNDLEHFKEIISSLGLDFDYNNDIKIINNPFNLHVGYNTKEKTVKITTDKDCLPTDINYYRLVEFESKKDLYNKIEMIENIGYHVCLDTTSEFYETEEK